MLRRAVAVAGIAAMAALLGAPTAAQASRPAIPEEVQSMEVGASLQFKFGRPVEVELSEVRVSTVEPVWAAGQEAYRENPRQPFTRGFAIFYKATETLWEPAIIPSSDVCGPGVALSISIAAQYDLALPHCPLAGARLGDPTFISDSSGRLRSEPRSLSLTVGSARILISDLSTWSGWTVNRSAEAFSAGRFTETRADGGGPKHVRVFVEAMGYGHCDGQLVFRRIGWRSASTPGVKRRTVTLPCD